MTNIHNLPRLKYKEEFQTPQQLTSLTLETLMDLKSQIDDDLTSLFNQLNEFNANMNTDLLTLDGFPRQDIDVAQIRTIRAQIRRLQTDYTWISNELVSKMESKFN